MSTNKRARERLEMQYGKGCMFKKAKVEQQVEKLKTIKTYRKFLQETKYTGKKIHLLEKNMTYHHLRHNSEGGKATDENGAIVNELAHRYIHSLPREQEEIVNNMLRQYKINFRAGSIIATDKEVKMEDPIQLEFDLNLDNDDFLVIPLERNNQKYNRAKAKKELKELIQEYEDYEH